MDGFCHPNFLESNFELSTIVFGDPNGPSLVFRWEVGLKPLSTRGDCYVKIQFHGIGTWWKIVLAIRLSLKYCINTEVHKTNIGIRMEAFSTGSLKSSRHALYSWWCYWLVQDSRWRRTIRILRLLQLCWFELPSYLEMCNSIINKLKINPTGVATLKKHI